MTYITTATPEPDSGRVRGAIPVALDGYPYIFSAALATALTCWLGWYAASIICGILCLFTLHFLRDFEQDTRQEDGVFVYPANGKVIRAPMMGTITDMEYIEGKFMNASFEKACDENERKHKTGLKHGYH